ncbi:DEAD/DEAH box helicase family protein [Acidimicrobiia bacterium EGI L10123]|uniref:type I restriction endonuclease subunit R n=1 Tax=Salinilacustrithrix flava TaxID=2957203 RepID=UPI003D7C213F|nr:DEAD/DEAH box helicase family protein [Acidimicrobiia bacterium EGI L10123]
MPGIHTEDQFQQEVAAALVADAGWAARPPADVHKVHRLIADDLYAFLEDTQPKVVAELDKRAKASQLNWKTVLLEAVVADLDKRPGQVLELLRHGKKILNVPVRFCFFKPAHGFNAELLAAYDANRLTVVREAPVRKPDGTWGELDIALYVNGFPVADAEMKNSMTSSRVDEAIQQYLTDRDHHDTHLRNRAVVHFAFDTDDVFMATLLAANTRFLPFNRGSSPDGTGGKGNYDSDDGSHATSYMWRGIWQRDTFLDILHRFVHISHTDDAGKPLPEPKLIFPRFHQWDAVTKLERDALQNGPGQTYLVQHSAGSGKSNTIGWTAHRLAGLHDADDQRIFDKVVVITDRTILDSQLRAVVEQFERKSAKGKVVGADTSADLADALARPSVRIVVTTLQKFPFAKQLDVLQGLDSGAVAVLIDEAHSSQSGDSAKKMKETLTASSLEEAESEEGWDDDEDDEVTKAIAASAAARKRSERLSMFAFTATPKSKTRELFGTAYTDADGAVKYRPFHVYSMRQAIEEGFILDTLANYTTYDVYWRLATSDDELVEKSKAAAAAARFASLHPHVINQKVEIIVEHFREHVAHRIGGKAKAMIVTRSRLHAVRYKLALDDYIAKKGYTDLKALVAFSGKVTDPDAGLPDPYTETNMNGFPESQTAKRFGTGEYQVMVVAEKYQTGFDQPLLHTMYVDKPLKGVAAVQTLGRLNRMHPDKDETFVLDFVNDADDIKKAFDPYYTTSVSVATSPQVLSEIWERVEDYLVIDSDDVDAFAAVWFVPVKPADAHEKISETFKGAELRFAGLDGGDQEEFRRALLQFLRIYAFLAQVLPYGDTDAEKNFEYCKILARKLAAEGPGSYDPSDRLDLTHVNITRGGAGAIELDPGQSEEVSFSDGTGSLTPDEKLLLSEVVAEVNERFGKDLTDVHKVMGATIAEVVSEDPSIQEQAAADQSDEAFALGAFDSVYMDAILEVFEQNTDFGKELLNNTELRDVMRRWILPLARRKAAEKHLRPQLPIDD